MAGFMDQVYASQGGMGQGTTHPSGVTAPPPGSGQAGPPQMGDASRPKGRFIDRVLMRQKDKNDQKSAMMQQIISMMDQTQGGGGL